jgi:ornithine cyclodeaminase
MVLFSAKTGMLEALLLDNGYLTDVRTAAAGGLAARHLARADCRTAGVIGTGGQARLQVRALKLVRDIERLLVWGRDGDKARAYAAEMSEALGITVEVQSSPEAVVRGADVVVTTTPSRAPLVEADWLHPGLHITAMGSDSEHKNELAPAVLAAADRFVCDSRAQSARLGELHHALAAGVLTEAAPVTEIGNIVAGTAPGRASEAAVTLCDLTGTGAQDTAIALYAYRRARDGGKGVTIRN